jgi:hypothetical protein
LEASKANRKYPSVDNHKMASEASDEVVKMIGELVEACKILPGSEEALKLFQEQDELEQLAEKELTNAAAAIENAAKTLLEAKRRQLELRKNKESPLPEEEITEAILDAARAITAATGTLVNAASVAQVIINQSFRHTICRKSWCQKERILYRPKTYTGETPLGPRVLFQLLKVSLEQLVIL